jgi:hypothetical protein
MNRILFLGLCVILIASAHAQGPVEIYARGQKYGSLQDYLASKKSAATQVHRKLSDADLHRLYVLSIENGMVNALQDFYQAWGNADLKVRRISLGQVQDLIRQAVTSSKSTKLLIVQPGKLRIMSLTK